MLTTDDLVIFFENAIALNNVSTRVEEGEIVGLIGPNGSGKSTWMYAVAGILDDRSRKEERRGGERITVVGRVALDGHDLTGALPHRRVERGMVLCPERRRLFRESTVEENLAIGAYRRPRRERGELSARVWRLFPELFPLRHRRAGLLSGGEQQMVALGRALMAKPRIFLIDEPLLGLAPLVQTRVVDAIRHIREEGVTVVIAEQHARPILPLLDRGYVLESGTVTLAGTREELLDNAHVRGAYFGMDA